MTGLRIVKNSAGQSRQIAYADFQTLAEAEACVKNMANEKMVFLVSKPPSLNSKDAENQTAFIKGINPTVTEAQLQKELQACGSITEIRLPKSHHSPNQNRGICYVVFEKPESVDSCIKMFNGREISESGPMKGWVVQVQRTKSTQEIKKAHEQDRKSVISVHVSNLSFKTKTEHLEDFFKQTFKHIDVVQVVIVKDKEGRSKGYAYVHLKSSEAQLKVLEQARSLRPEQLKLQGRVLGVRGDQARATHPDSDSGASPSASLNKREQK